MKAQPHPRQAERLAALESYEILDTPREAEFDEIAALASAICETPIAVVNLIDADRQWFKAEVGLGVRETPLKTSICSHVILEDEFVEIPDTVADDRLADNPLCLGEPGLRFYAGAQLRTEDGLPLGTLCVLDNAPRALTELQRHALKVLARQVMTQLDLRRALKAQRVLALEVDHRVKNSLQMVSSLLRAQTRAAGDPGAVEELEKAGRQVETISQLHAELYLTSQAGEVDLAQYLGRVVELLGESCPAAVRIGADVAPCWVRANAAAAIGMIVNEFVTNSLKYAFPDGRDGSIAVHGEALDGERYRVALQDDGVGMPGEGEPGRRRGLGSRIIEAAAAQLGASLEMPPTERGTRIEITFQPNKPRNGSE